MTDLRLCPWWLRPVLWVVALLALACTVEPLPEDLHEAGWDRVSAEVRRDVLRADLHATLEALEEATPAQRPMLVRQAARELSALRPELLVLPDGRPEYEALEDRVKRLSGDRP